MMRHWRSATVWILLLLLSLYMVFYCYLYTRVAVHRYLPMKNDLCKSLGIDAEQQMRAVMPFSGDILDLNRTSAKDVLKRILQNTGGSIMLSNGSELYGLLVQKIGLRTLNNQLSLSAHNNNNWSMGNNVYFRRDGDKQFDDTAPHKLDSSMSQTNYSQRINGRTEENVAILREGDLRHVKNETRSQEPCTAMGCDFRGCTVEVRGYSEGDTKKTGFIAVDGEIKHKWHNTTGVYVAQFYPWSCRVKDIFRFDCRVSASMFLAFLSIQTHGSVIVAVSAGDSIRDLAKQAPFFQEWFGLWLVPDPTDSLALWGVKGEQRMGDWAVMPSGDGPLQWKFGIPFSRVAEKTLNITMHPYNLNTLRSLHPHVQPGGRYEPPRCKALWKVAIIVPFRDRDEHMKIFLANMLPFLQQQNITFTIFIVEQALPEAFNRASLMNIGYLEASRIDSFDCYVFHDVDLIPENLCNLYHCHTQPRHLSAAVDKFDYRLPYDTIFGGATILSPSHMEAMNGFPNIFFGWGGEDDNIAARVRHANFTVQRYPPHIARYRMLIHGYERSNPKAGRTYQEAVEHIRYSHLDGLNTTNYKVLRIDKKPLYTHIRVQIPGPRNDNQVAAYFKLASELFYRSLYGSEDPKTQSNNKEDTDVEIRPPTVKPKLETLSPNAKKRRLPSMIRKENTTSNNTRESETKQFGNKLNRSFAAGQNHVGNTANKTTMGQPKDTPNKQSGTGEKHTGNTKKQNNPRLPGDNPRKSIRPISITGGKPVNKIGKEVGIQNRNHSPVKMSPKLSHVTAGKEPPQP